jgi:Mrp family chromosome partitioning ATPase
LASAHHGEGRTCVTLNLAAALARAKQRVIVIDTDLQRPSVSRLLGIDSEVGLAEAVTLGLQPEEAIMRIAPADFHVLPTRGQVENSAELLASPAFSRMLNLLDMCYDFILFDSAPLLASADARLLGLHTHATLLVVRPGNTSTSEMGKSIALLNEETLFGVVMNRVSV